MFLLPGSLFGVVAEDVALAPFTITDDDLLGLEIVLENSIATTLAEHITLDLRNAGHAAGQQILATGLGQLCPVCFRVHAGIGNEHRSS